MSEYNRTHTCGELGVDQIGKEVELCGWVATRRDHGKIIFIDLRDRYGLTQIIFDPEIENGLDAHLLAGELRSEYVIACKGKVRHRPTGTINDKIKTGEVEVACYALTVLSESKTPPFPIEDESEVNESLRFKYRYLDLRRTPLQNNLKIRHQMLSLIRNHLDQNQFIEVETPILYKSTPEGARDFLVPSRLNHGAFYALPQSPQTLKQLLMIGGLDRYYQIARCFRDEDLRSDRQPEFSQIDIEASFIQEETFFTLLETMIAKLWKDILHREISTPFPRMTYKEAMTRFGSDKPDIRFGLELNDLSDIFRESQFLVFQNALKMGPRGKKGSIRAIVVREQAETLSRKDLDDYQAFVAPYGAKGLLWIKMTETGELQSPATKFFSEKEKKELIEKLALQPKDLVFAVADTREKIVFDSLGALRIDLGNRLGLIPKTLEERYAFVWITDFPLLEYDEKEKRYFACHHPFTSPKSEYLSDFLAGQNLDSIQAAAYDLVLNGVEIGGGSLRIYRSDVQEAMFKALGLTLDEAKEKFGFFLEALQYGTPPHGGIAFGVERLAALLCGAHAIRDVMAFPKTQKGQCLMSETPSFVKAHQLTELGISIPHSADAQRIKELKQKTHPTTVAP